MDLEKEAALEDHREQESTPAAGCAERETAEGAPALEEGAFPTERNRYEIMNRLSREAPRRAEELSALIYEQMPGEANIRLEVTLIPPSPEDRFLRAGLRIGQRKLYVVRDIPRFLEALENREPCTFGKGFEYQPEWMHFTEADQRILALMGKLVSALSAGRWLPSGAEARLIRIPGAYAADLLELLREVPMRVMLQSGETLTCRRIAEMQVPIHIEMHLTPRGISLLSSMSEELLPLTEDYAYLLAAGKVFRVPAAQRALVGYLARHQTAGRLSFDFSLAQTGQVIGEVLPYLRLRAAVEMGEELRSRLVQFPLRAKVYFDKEGSHVAAQVEFHYGTTVLNPFGAVREKIALDRGEKLLLRDAEAEHRVLDILANAGFRVTKENIRLTGQEEIYDFVSSGVQKLSELCEVYLSREFRRMTPRRPTLSGGMRMDGDKLLFSLKIDGEPTDEVLGILEALSRKRNYYRLKDGSFLKLDELEGWQEPAESLYEAAVRDGAELNRDEMVLRGYRTAYLLNMLEEKRLNVEADESVRSVIEQLQGSGIGDAPETGIALRDYQKRGYEWLYHLDRMHMGGVLADDMGLGKTVQVISLLRVTRDSRRTSLIVAPTSLTYNWLSEINRFAPELSAAVVSGTAAQRAHLLRHVREHGDLDVLITSYPLIRRDIALIRDFRFRFAILDEAQNIKNAGSIGAVSVKALQADTRFALTGTPMENGVGELWSIFDFVLPGYLPGYNAFLRRYQDGIDGEDLKRRIRPFLTRRLKQDVLAELPDKIETRLTALMTPEQRNVYQASMERLRPKVNRLMAEKGLNRSRIEVLSAITELRQICCHPSLVLDGYTGSSGKMELLLEILPEMIRNGRRVLIFSQFTSMLKILRPHLEERGWPVMYLDGDTPAGQRLEMTEEFNRGQIPIFLISLRAGGSGLNLTGADVVIHYDPWWNPATEDQATDRAHRIGQTKKVNVIRLVMGESIEEQVVELGTRKKALFDRLITPGEAGLAALSEQDVRALFA